MKKLLVILLLFASPCLAQWSFTIKGDPASTNVYDADLRESDPSTPRGSFPDPACGDYYGDYYVWIAFRHLGETLSTGNGGAGYSGTIDTAFIRWTLTLVNRFDAASDTFGVQMFPCRREPNETYLCWNDYDNGLSWSTAGAKNTTTDIYDAPRADTTFITNSPGQFTTFDAFINPTYIAEAYEDWIMKAVHLVSVDYIQVASSEYSNAAYRPVLHVISNAAAEAGDGAIGGVTLGGVTLGQ